MKCYVRNSDTSAIAGPFSIEYIEAKLKRGEIPADARATGDIGESLARVRRYPAANWVGVTQIPDIGEIGPPNRVEPRTIPSSSITS